jgi:hypothetical protein
MRINMIKRITLLLCLANAAAHGNETLLRPAVCLQVETPDPRLISALARRLATRIFSGIGIPLDWRNCKPDGEFSPTPIVVELVSRTPEDFQPGALGYAMPDRRRIVIFFDRIEPMEGAWAVLGHVMVHELAHVIQGVPRHSRTGMMKPHWSAGDLMEMRYKSLPFAREDVILLYSRLAIRRESTATPTAER